MSIRQFLEALNQQEIHLWVEHGKLRYSAPAGRLTPELRQELLEHKEEILVYLASQQNRLAIAPVSRQKPIPASFAQQRLWLFSQLEPSGSVYNVTDAYRLNGPLDLDALRRALDEIVRRHEALRTTLEYQGEDLVQIIHNRLPGGSPLHFVDLTCDSGGAPDQRSLSERQAEAQRLQIQSGRQPFDLSTGPLLRIFLARLDNDEYLLRVTMHHSVTDGWSMSIFFGELSRLYAAFSQHHPSPLLDLPIQYADYSVWQRAFLNDETWNAQESYWQKQLGGDLRPLYLPLEAPRPAKQTFTGNRIEINLTEKLSMDLRSLSRGEHVTLFMLLLSAFDVLLYRYTGQEDVLVGAPIANRQRKELEQLIGFFANTLVMRVDLSGKPTFRELLHRVRETALQAFDHQDMPFEHLLQRLNLERDLSRSPLFQVSFALQNMPVEQLQFERIRIERLPMDKDSTPFDWTVLVWDDQRALRVHWAFNADLFSCDAIERAIDQFTTLLEAVVANPDLPIDRLPLLDAETLARELVLWNSTQRPYARHTPLAELFEAQVEKFAGEPALIMGEQTWNYRQLNQRANHLGRTLLALGVQPGDLVGVCLERSAEMIASFLAILKVGGAYVPLDPAYPEERLQFMLEDSGVRVCISQASLAERLRAANLHLLLLDQDAGELAMNQLDNLGPLRSTNALAGETLAYVMYTSGSTGAPKGICIPQGAISRLVLNTDYLQIQPRDRIAQASNASFDAATFEIWGALLNGGCLVFVPQETALSPGGLGQLIREQGIQVMFLTTALFNQIAAFQPQTFQPLRTLLFGGEAVTPGSVRAVLEAGPPQRLLHVYGPTESTTFATWHLVSQVAENAQTIPIGKPITNTLAYILDGRLQPLPVGVAGELYLGGDGLAAGYLNRPELTAKKFITNPYGAGRLYRTGDMARRLADGDIEFIGRIDQQVKLRGFRVELGEIEAVLEACPGVYRAVVLLREDEPGAKRLVAYLTLAPGEQPTPAELRAQLKTRLPDFMLPAAFVILEAFPVSPNGKIDRRALPAPSGERLDAGKEIVAPRDDLEASLCQSWGEILNVHPLGIHDNFFELGGHSLLAVRLLEQIARQYGRRLPLVSLFEAPTVAQLASLMRREEQQAAQIALVPIQAQGVQQPFFFLPNFGGGLFNLKPLANAMGVQRPFYSFQPRGLDGNQPPHNSLPEMAAYYIRAMRAFQPEGPYLIGGFCFGGVVAYEMARQLEAQGQRASLLAIVDGYAPGQAVQGRSFRRLWIFLRNFPYWLHDFLGMGPREMWVNIRRRMLMIGKQLVGKFGKPVEVRPADLVIHQPPDTPDSYQRLMEAHMQAILDYRAGTYRGCVKVLRVQRMPLFSQYDPDLGWGRLAHGGVEIEFVPGGHHNMLEPPYVFDLAAQLNRIIEKAC